MIFTIKEIKEINYKTVALLLWNMQCLYFL